MYSKNNQGDGTSYHFDHYWKHIGKEYRTLMGGNLESRGYLRGQKVNFREVFKQLQKYDLVKLSMIRDESGDSYAVDYLDIKPRVRSAVKKYVTDLNHLLLTLIPWERDPVKHVNGNLLEILNRSMV